MGFQKIYIVWGVPEAWRQCFSSPMNSRKLLRDGWTGRDLKKHIILWWYHGGLETREYTNNHGFCVEKTIITFSMFVNITKKRIVSHQSSILQDWDESSLAIFEIPIKDWYLSGGCSNIGMEPWLVRISQVVTRLRHKGLTLLQTTKSQNQMLSSWLNRDLILISLNFPVLRSFWKGSLSGTVPDFFYGCQVSLELRKQRSAEP